MYSEVFEKYSEYVEKYKDLLFATEKYLYSIPEIGYKEFKTAAYLEKEFEKLGYTLTRAGNIPGFYTDIDTGRPGPKVVVFGELDAVICAEHEFADKETGAVHSCGHHCQTTALLGVAAALKCEGALDDMCGSIRLCAVPAEELLDIPYREELKQKGIIKYFGGKIEFLYRGYFDDCDMAFMVHMTGGSSHRIYSRKGANGCVMKNVEVIGKAAHAGSAPNRGVNALYATTNAFNTINALRETFVDDMGARIHSIVNEGGQMVNAIPSSVKIETQVRGRTWDVIKDASMKTNRAYASAAAGMGARVKIQERPGYSPVCNDDGMMALASKVMPMCTSPELIADTREIGGGCSDMGDIMSVMPGYHPYVSGAEGPSHSATYRIRDVESATVFNAKFQLVYLHELLKDNAKEAKIILENYKPIFKSKKEYFEMLDKFDRDRELVTYNEDGTITLDV